MPSQDSSLTLLLSRGMRRGWLTLARERWYGATLLTLFGVLLLAQLLLVVTLGVQGMHQLLQSRLDLRLQVQEGALDQDVQQFLVAVRTLPYVAHVTYITREQAYEQERTRNPDLIAFLEQFHIKNPFPDTIAVTLSSLDRYDAFAEFSRQAQWRTVVDPTFLSQATDQEQQVHALLRVTDAGTALVLFFLLLIAGILLFVLIELVRRRALMRREEIFVERLVGAQEFAVLIPFATEAALLLLGAVLLSSIAIVVLLFALPLVIPALSAAGPFAALRAQMAMLLPLRLPLLFLLELLLVPVLALAGAYVGMRPQMRRGKLLA